MKKRRTERIVMGVCIGICAFFAATIALRFLTRQILVKRLHMDHAFTRIVWFDNQVMGTVDDRAIQVEDVDWEARYPFPETGASSENGGKATESRLRHALDEVQNVVDGIEEKVENYATDYLVFHSEMVESASAYEQLIGWNFASFGEYNGIVELPDGYLTSFVERRDVTDQLRALEDIDRYCKAKGMEFLFVQAPYKISEYEDTDVSGIQDFSNQNANDLLNGLEHANVDYYDIRETIREERLDHHSLFYRTDHHWLTTTGLWASRQILRYCNEQYGWQADLERLDEKQFQTVTYQDWFLGSQGKKVTLARTQPDDFTLLYPKYDTLFSYAVPAAGIEAVGGYSIVYNMGAIDERDYYTQNPYGGCNYGDQPLIQIRNQMDADDHKILIIHDSFGDCVISCLALAEKEVDSLDIRHFTGSVKTYIDEAEPDLVIVMYNAGGIGGPVDDSTHQDMFDFR